MRRRCLILLIAVQVLMPRPAIGAPTVGVYDENVVQPNQVGATAPGSAYTVTEFTQAVADAFQNEHGGVMEGSVMSAKYDFGSGQTKSFWPQLGPFNSFGMGAPTSPRPISGTSAWAVNNSVAPLEIGLTDLRGAVGPDEHITKFAMTVLGPRGTPTGLVTLTATAYFGDGTIARTSFSPGPDEFLGFEAPPGEAIVKVQFRTDQVGFYFDDLGFITSDTRAPRIATQVRLPSVWAEAERNADGSFGIVSGPDTTNVRDRSGVHQRGMLQFSLADIPEGAQLISADLGFEQLIGPGMETVTVGLYGFLGDGQLSAEDALATAVRIGGIDVRGAGQMLAAELDVEFLQSVIDSGEFLGITAVMETPGGWISWNSQLQNQFLIPPQLELTYLVPEPSTALLSAFALVGLLGFRFGPGRRR